MFFFLKDFNEVCEPSAPWLWDAWFCSQLAWVCWHCVTSHWECHWDLDSSWSWRSLPDGLFWQWPSCSRPGWKETLPFPVWETNSFFNFTHTHTEGAAVGGSGENQRTECSSVCSWKMAKQMTWTTNDLPRFTTARPKTDNTNERLGPKGQGTSLPLPPSPRATRGVAHQWGGKSVGVVVAHQWGVAQFMEGMAYTGEGGNDFCPHLVYGHGGGGGSSQA